MKIVQKQGGTIRKQCMCGAILEVEPSDVYYDDSGHPPFFVCPCCQCHTKLNEKDANKEFMQAVYEHNGLD